MKYSLSLLGIKNCIEHDLQLNERVRVLSDLGETFNNPPCWDSSLSRNGLRHLEEDQCYASSSSERQDEALMEFDCSKADVLLV